MPTVDTDLPVVGITMGDAAGIGPEITLKALTRKNLLTQCRCIVIGDAKHLSRLVYALGLDIKLNAFDFAVSTIPEGISVVDLKNLPAEFEVGVDAAVTGKASAEYIEAA